MSVAFVLQPTNCIPKCWPDQSTMIRLSTRVFEVKNDYAGEFLESRFSGAGPITVDMNQYNLLNLDDIASEWIAVVMPATPLQEAGVYLQAKSKDKVLADTVKVSFPRKPGKGLGLELLELAGGRADGLGITIIQNVVPGGSAETSGILPGDSIIQVEVRKQTLQKTSALESNESDDVFAIRTECFGYDKTVDAILSLPESSQDPNVVETFVLTLKRLRRKPKVTLRLQYPPSMNEVDDVTLELFAGENLRRALLVRGVKLNDPLAKRFDSGGSGDCGAEGTCATCAVSIVRGQELLSPPGSTESQIFAKNPRWRMSCKTIVGFGMKEGNLTIRVNPKQWADNN